MRNSVMLVPEREKRHREYQWLSPGCRIEWQNGELRPSHSTRLHQTFPGAQVGHMQCVPCSM